MVIPEEEDDTRRVILRLKGSIYFAEYLLTSITTGLRGRAHVCAVSPSIKNTKRDD
jgi:hypothetical protein